MKGRVDKEIYFLKEKQTDLNQEMSLFKNYIQNSALFEVWEVHITH